MNFKSIKKYLLFIPCSVSVFLHGQTYPTTDFIPPIESKVILSGTFGELRPNHFHAGLDIKTGGKEGMPLLAIADGWVSRIKVSSRGYGKVLYIDHPNGYTSVYAHCQQFLGDIANYTTKLHYEHEKFELDFNIPKDSLKVTQGQQIALSGNTGGSLAPHLHFEIRDSETEKTINPLLFGIKITDNIAPIVRGIYVYPFTNHVNQKKTKYTVGFSKGNSIRKDTIYAFGKLGFGIKTNDKSDFANNNNGVYRIKILVNDELFYQHTMHSFSFEETRYINNLVDMDAYRMRQGRIIKAFEDGILPLSFIEKRENQGFLQVQDGNVYTVKIFIEDFYSNTSQRHFVIKGDNRNSIEIYNDNYESLLVPTKENKFEVENFTATFPAGTFYKGVPFKFSNPSQDVVQLHKSSVPIQSYFSMKWKPFSIHQEDLHKSVVVRKTNSGLRAVDTFLMPENTIEAKSRTLGTYTVVTDFAPPTIRFFNIKSNATISSNATIRLTIRDGLSGLKHYRASINGNWVLMEHDAKKKLFTIDLSKIPYVLDSSNVLTIYALDKKNNTNTEALTFNIK